MFKRVCYIYVIACLLVDIEGLYAQGGLHSAATFLFEIDTSQTFQTIHNFGASDAWSIQYVGSEWPVDVRQEVAELLFSQDTEDNGQPKGIGLSAWRFNIGGGSAEQGTASGIIDPWRRSECFQDANGDYDWTKQQGQQWFLKAASGYGVKDVIGFVNSPPVHLTKNHKAWSQGGHSSNLRPENYEDYAAFLVEVLKGVEQQTGVHIKYLSPFNEPQWEWKCCKQEGSPWTNDQIARLTRLLDAQFTKSAIAGTKIEIPEAAQLDFLSGAHQSSQRSGQIRTFFTDTSANSLTGLVHLAAKVCGHSYFSTWDKQRLIASRVKMWTELQTVDPALEYWATEYCLLEDNQEIKGPGKDLGMDPALYTARVIHADLVFAHASTWQWWLAVSVGDYKDGLVYLDKQDKRRVEPSKLHWVLGNFSRFIRPGSVRVHIGTNHQEYAAESLKGPMVSAYLTPNKEIVVVCINEETKGSYLQLAGMGQSANMMIYETSAAAQANLKPALVPSDRRFEVPARSVVTCVIALD